MIDGERPGMIGADDLSALTDVEIAVLWAILAAASPSSSLPDRGGPLLPLSAPSEYLARLAEESP